MRHIQPQTGRAHRGEVQHVFVSPEGQVEATIYWFQPFGSFDGKTEVVLKPVDAGYEQRIGYDTLVAC